MVQSMARDFGPKGVHVFLSIIDGLVGVPSPVNDSDQFRSILGLF